LETLNRHWCERYLGRKWHPTEFNCWHFLALVYEQERGVRLPLYSTDAQNTKAVARKISEVIDLGEWVQVQKPEEFDGVAMGKGSQVTHVGVWTESDGGAIIHNNEGHGVIAMNLQQARIHGYGLLKFYRHADNCRSSKPFLPDSV
jgi:hypothetical protein